MVGFGRTLSSNVTLLHHKRSMYVRRACVRTSTGRERERDGFRSRMPHVRRQKEES